MLNAGLSLNRPVNITCNNNDNDHFYNDDDDNACSNRKTACTQPWTSHLSLPRQWCWSVHCWHNVGTTLSTPGQCRTNPICHSVGCCHSQRNRWPRTVPGCKKSSPKSPVNVHIIHILVWVCDPTLRSSAFSRFNTKVQYYYRTYQAQFMQL